MSTLRQAVLAMACAIALAIPCRPFAEPPASQATEAKGDQGKSGEENRAWGKPVEGQALSIATSKAAYACGEDIVVRMSLKNVGRTVVVDPRHRCVPHCALYYSFSVTVPGGEAVPMTRLGKVWFQPCESASGDHPFGWSGRLEPGGCFGERVSLDWYFDMARPATYVVQAKWKVVANGGRLSLLQALSNKLEASILARSLTYLGFLLAPQGISSFAHRGRLQQDRDYRRGGAGRGRRTNRGSQNGDRLCFDWSPRQRRAESEKILCSSCRDRGRLCRRLRLLSPPPASPGVWRWDVLIALFRRSDGDCTFRRPRAFTRVGMVMRETPPENANEPPRTEFQFGLQAC